MLSINYRLNIMPYNSIIHNKCQYYSDYINKYNLADSIFDKHKKRTYTSDIYLYMYFLFHETGLSYEKFYRIFDYAAQLNGKKYPKKSCLHSFKKKLADININESIINDFNKEHNAITKSISIDSTDIFNKSNSNLANKFSYKKKKLIKVHQIVNESGHPLCLSISEGTINDAIEGYNLINSNINMFNGIVKTVYADKGYDSNHIRELLNRNKCHPIIPHNDRNKDSDFIKQLKKEAKGEKN